MKRQPGGGEVVLQPWHGLEGLEEIAPEWERLCEATAAPPLLGPAWIRAHVSAYERSDRLVLLTARHAGGLAAVLPLVRGRATLRGLPVRMLRGAGNRNTLRFDLTAVAGPAGEAVLDALWQQVAAWQDWDCLQLPETPAGGPAAQWVEIATAAGYRVGRWASKSVPYIAIGEGETGMEQTSRDFRAHLRWARRRLEALAPLRLETEKRPQPAALESFYQFEAAGWKGHAADGQALLRKGPEARRFFHELAEGAAAADQFVVHRLCLGEQVIASSLGLEDAHAYYLVKTSYDEQYARYSPGHLLTEALVHAAAGAGRRRFDFCGEAFAYEGRWTRERLPHAFLFVFPPTTRGRLLYSAKFGGLDRWMRRCREWRGGGTRGRSSAAAR
ncbi:MAG TPA: GNAT family N-acetyltransferase [Terriglobales bacterium]